jgi:hypothetical protein
MKSSARNHIHFSLAQLLKGKTPLIGTGLLIGIFFSFGLSYIRAQGSETIYGCVRDHIGIVRIVGEHSRCLPLERKISWNVQGPAGTPGPMGPAGATGEQGLPGETGPSGIPGASGLMGSKGDTGAAGYTGSTGTTGPAGAKGDFGAGLLVCPGCQLDERIGNRLTGQDITNAILYGSTLRNLNVQGTKFYSAVIDGSTFSNVNAFEASFENASLRGVVFENTNLEKVNFSGTDLSGAVFRTANLKASSLSKSSLTGAIFENTTCPDLSNSDRNGNTCDGHF